MQSWLSETLGSRFSGDGNVLVELINSTETETERERGSFRNCHLCTDEG